MQFRCNLDAIETFSSVQYSKAATSKNMPPKKSKAKESKTNKSSEKCNFNNRGYCKSREDCTKKHSDIVCDDLECDEVKCNKRHPYDCKYGIRCKFNRRKECAYSHVTLVTDDSKSEALKKHHNDEMRKLENTLRNMQKE